jgi:hypothetical protein
MSNQINYINYKIIDDTNYYQKKYLKYKIKYLNEKEIINYELSGGAPLDNLVILIINKITFFLDKKEGNQNYLENISEDDKSNINNVLVKVSDSNDEKIVIYIIKFILCIICHALQAKKSIINILTDFLEAILEYIDKQIDTDELLAKLKESIPCLAQFNDILKHTDLKFLFETLRDSIKISVINYTKNIKSFLLIKTKNFKDYIQDIEIITNFNYLKSFKHVCSNKMTTFYSRIINKIDKQIFDFNNPYKQLTGGYNIKIGCYQYSTDEIMKLYKYFKDFTNEQIRDFLVNVEENLLKILFVIKYLNNFIFRIIFRSKPSSLGFKALDFLDSIISISITLYYLTFDKINEYIFEFLSQLLLQHSNNIVYTYILEICKALISGESCTM